MPIVDDSHRYMDSNRRSWDARTPAHFRSRFYDVDGFKAGASSLHSLEIEEVGDASGKSLLHLQCHFGLDTMSLGKAGSQGYWGRLLGGGDIAGSIAERGAQDRRAVRRLESSTTCRMFWMAVSTWCSRRTASLTWLPDLEGWAGVIAHFLEPGGFLYVLDSHPFGNVFYDEEDAVELRPFYPYSTRGTGPLEFPPGSTYTDGPQEQYGPTFEWSHSVGDILNALISAGLTIDFFHEFHFAGYEALPMMEKSDDGWWRLEEGGESVPFLFSLEATKPTVERFPRVSLSRSEYFGDARLAHEALRTQARPGR